jgi:predicted AAA+ superfamily ATPase
VDSARIAAARAPALMWALERASRSGRVAWQFARDYAAQDAAQDAASAAA